MAKKNQREVENSLLNTNSAKAQLEEDYEQPLSKKQILKVVAVVAAVVVFVAALLIVGGIVSENIEQKKWLRAPSESMSAFYAAQTKAPITEKQVDAIITQAYYTNEKGLQVFLNFGNGLEAAQRVTKIFITIRDTNAKGAVIAEGNTDKISEQTVVPAKENLDFQLYLPPQFVKDNDNSLKNIYYDVTLEYVPAK